MLSSSNRRRVSVFEITLCIVGLGTACESTHQTGDESSSMVACTVSPLSDASRRLSGFLAAHRLEDDKVFAKFLRSTHYAFGNTRFALRFGWEMEGDSNAILLFFGPKDKNARLEWLGLPLKDREKKFRETYGGKWSLLSKLPTMPDFVGKDLGQETPGTWEIKDATYVETLADLADRMRWISGLGLGQSFHVHVSFVLVDRETTKLYAHALSRFAVGFNEYFGMQAFRWDKKNVTQHLVAVPAYTISELESDLIDAKIATSDNNYADYKFYGMGVREGLYDISDLEPGMRRVGFELRAAVGFTFAIEHTVKVILFLEDPSTKVRFGSSADSPYALDYLDTVPTLQSSDFGSLDEGTRMLFEIAAQRLTIDPESSKPEDVKMHWTWPFLHFEDRPIFSAWQQQQIIDGREGAPGIVGYRQEINKLVRTHIEEQVPIDDETVDHINNHVHTWALQFPVEAL